ncbi:uncharacterized protein FOMMEDRAFT_169493 [Fomitiporia mediterranea MF3/22]|uniref:uncharacterized protein n=1 Tax=Fomitiporia mediterranea (strain MF3/22) TaxID=694068 RepID=UPI000440839A|nr:uncharacterized protein FOMMEDRAFT_169493 [Fomitiporia mediterranea MF3/22]EJD01355.1 hypothetical protein FOMMEDRAFT_169493 [Fomitiporia mediterranea MF3/22]
MAPPDSAKRDTTSAKVTAARADETQSPGTRKRHCCKKCGKPMLGHKRGQCSVDTTNKVVTMDEPCGVSEQLATLRIGDPDGSEEIDGNNKADKVDECDRRRHFSEGFQEPTNVETPEPASHTSEGNTARKSGVKRGAQSRDVIADPDTSSKIQHWLEGVPAAECLKGSRRKRLSVPPVEPPRDFDAMIDLPQQQQKSAITKSHRLPNTAYMLERTSSVTEREQFFSQLVQKSKKPIAGVFTIDMKEIRELEQHARRLNFHARVIAPEYADGTTGLGWLVVGKDEDSVKKLFSEVEGDVKSGHSYMATLGTVATESSSSTSLLVLNLISTLLALATPPDYFRVRSVCTLLCYFACARLVFTHKTHQIRVSMSAHSPSPSPGPQRKPRTCRTCGLPMKGHQRSTCIPSHSMHQQTSSSLMPPPDTTMPGPSQIGARLPAPNTRPIMPGSYGNDRPSEISGSPGPSGPSPTRSLRDRIGAKIEEESAVLPPYTSEMHNAQYPRRVSAPLESYPTMIIGGSTGYAASASGSAYGSSSTIVMPEHSISHRFIRHDRATSEGPNQFPNRLADRLGGYETDGYEGADNDDYDDDGMYELDHSFEDGEESGSDPAYPSDGSVVGGGASASSYYASESDAGTFSTAGLSSAPSFGALVRGSGASQLYTAYEVGAKYVPFLRDRARRRGYALHVVPGSQEDVMDENGRRKKSSREPGNVRIVLGRDEAALKQVTRRVARQSSALPGPSRQMRNRTRSIVGDPQAHFYSPQPPHPPHFQSPYPTPQPGLPYPPPASAVQPQPQLSSWRSFCLTITVTVAAVVVLLFALIGVLVIFARAPE